MDSRVSSPWIHVGRPPSRLRAPLAPRPGRNVSVWSGKGLDDVLQGLIALHDDARRILTIVGAGEAGVSEGRATDAEDELDAISLPLDGSQLRIGAV
jgi:hypothetical protein